MFGEFGAVVGEGGVGYEEGAEEGEEDEGLGGLADGYEKMGRG